MKIIFEQTGPIYFTENLNLEEKREFPIKILIEEKGVFTGSVFDGEDYNLLSGNSEHSLEETMEYILDIDDFWNFEGCDQIHNTYKDFVVSVYQHGQTVLNGKANWNDFIKLSEEI